VPHETPCAEAAAIGLLMEIPARLPPESTFIERQASNDGNSVFNFWQDVRYGFRGLSAQPMFTAIAVLTLALGVGSAAAIFSVIQNVLLDPAPYRDIDRVSYVQIHDVASRSPTGRFWFQLPEYLEYARQSTVFEDIIGGTGQDVLLRTDQGTEQFAGSLVTANTFAFLGVPPLVGRPIVASDADAGAPPVFVMSNRMWMTRYNSDPGVVGRTFVLNSIPTTCVGVMPPRFTKGGADVWMPIALERASDEMRNRYFSFQGKLKPDVTLDQVTAEMDVIARRVAQQYPNNYPKQFTVRAVSWLDTLVRDFRGTLYTLFAAVGVLLLIACSNVANMLLARGAARDKEIAIRVSMGATRWVLIRQLLIESLLLAAGGAVFGCLFGYAAIKGVAAILPQGTVPTEVIIRMNVPVLLFSLAVGILTALVFGLVPALQTVKRNLADPLKDTARGVVGGFRRGRLRSALVVAEVALSLVLLAGAGLLMRSFMRMQTTDLGFDPDNVFVARLVLPEEQYQAAAAKRQFFDNLIPRLQTLPGVVTATVSTDLPPYGGIGTEIEIPGKTHPEPWRASYHLVSEGYFPTVGRRLLRGRLLDATDVAHARKVAVINQTLVRRFFGTDDPIGRQIHIKHLETLRGDEAVPNAMFDIIGVVADAKNDGVVDPPEPEAFIPHGLTGAFWRAILVKTQGSPEAITNSVRREIWSVDRGVAMTFVGTLNGYLQQFTYAQPQFSVVLLGVFSAVGLALVALGVYSVIAYTVSRQTREIGVRMALGAGRRDVLRMVAAMGLRLIAVGAAIGLLFSFAATRVIANQLTGVSPHDPLTLAGVILLMTLVGLAACYFPAERASRVDPMVALRVE
jgi:putative ABC transport system permease protein